MSVKYMFVGSKSKNTFQVQAGHQGALLYSNNDDCILNFGVNSLFFDTPCIKVDFRFKVFRDWPYCVSSAKHLRSSCAIHSEGAVKYLPQPSVFTGEKGIASKSRTSQCRPQ
uniref:Uncharacterized protein n=1 Tax=Ditylenchus dipsaci TaxID=166011 RepID=A0A915E9C1_9BILA